MVGFPNSGSCLALAHLPRKPFCGYPLHYSWLDYNQTEKSSPSSSSSLCHPISSDLRPQISYSTPETIFLSGYGLEALQGSWRDSGSQLSQRSCCFFIYDGNSFSSLVSAIRSDFFHPGRVYRMDPNLLGCSLPNRCDCRGPSWVWDH